MDFAQNVAGPGELQSGLVDDWQEYASNRRLPADLQQARPEDAIITLTCMTILILNILICMRFMMISIVIVIVIVIIVIL